MYRGLADPSPTFKRRGLVVLLLLLVGAFLQALLGSGNSHGLGNLGSARIEAADLAYVRCGVASAAFLTVLRCWRQ